MALTVEDGTGKADANSYVSIADARTFAAARGATLPAADATVEQLLTQALDYVESLRDEFKGSKNTKAQALQWPRYGVYIDGFAVDADEIPAVLWKAQAQLACDAYGGGTTLDLMPSGAGREIVSETVEGAVSVTYAQSGNSNPQPALTKARALLAPLLEGASGYLEVVRV